jgi:succinoglycan biosynthesis protein ExoO
VQSRNDPVASEADSPRASVIVAAFDAETFVAEAIESALAQTERDLEVIVVDDASRDGTANLVMALSAADSRVRLIRQEVNQGPSAARNRAIDAARGQWLVVLDADDRMRPERVARLIDFAEATGADLVADNPLEVRDKPGTAALHLYPAHVLARDEPLELVDVLAGEYRTGGPRSLGFLKPVVRRSLLLACGIRYPEEIRVGEDLFVLALCLAHGAIARTSAESYYLYQRRGGSLTTEPNWSRLEQRDLSLGRELLRLGVDGRTVAITDRSAARARRNAAYFRMTGALKQRRPIEAARALLEVGSPVVIAGNVAKAVRRRVTGRAGRPFGAGPDKLHRVSER